MHKIEVGKPYSETRSDWPECVEYNWMPRFHELRLFFQSPKPSEVQAVKSGKVEFALTIEQDIIFLLFQFHGAYKGQKGIDWSDAPYSWHRVQLSPNLDENDRGILPPTDIGPQERSLLNIILSTAPAGIVMAIRTVSLSHEFTEKLFQAICTQAYKPYDQQKYDRSLDSIYALNNSKQLLKRAIVRCIGGD